MNNVCVTSYELVCASYDYSYVSIDVLPEAICCYLQCLCTKFQLHTSYIVCASYDHIYVSIDVLPEALCCYLHVIMYVDE